MLILLTRLVNGTHSLSITYFKFLSGDAVAFAGTGMVLFTSMYAPI